MKWNVEYVVKNIKDIKFKYDISELTAIKSNAGWYIGKLYNDEGCIMPYSRNTHYMGKDDVTKLVDDTDYLRCLDNLT